MIRLFSLVVLSSTIVNSNPNVVSQPANQCAYYGTNQCCPLLNTTNANIKNGEMKPMYVTFAPTSAVQNVDNICYTAFPLPDDCNTFQLFISTVYCDGTNTVDTFILTQNSLGTFTSGSPQCTFVDIEFAMVQDNVFKCNTGVLYRCVLSGDCPKSLKGVLEPIFGISFVRQPIPSGCWKPINDVIQSNGFVEQDYFSLPMKLPSRCVFPQTCSVTPTVQLFQSAAGFNYIQRPNCLIY